MTDKHTPGPAPSEIEQLKSTIANYTAALGKRLNEIRRLKGVNTELLEAMETAEVYFKGGWYNTALDIIHAAIKAAKGNA